MQTFRNSLGMLRRLGKTLGPYLMLEILLPGGTLLALGMFLYRRRLIVPAPAFASVRWTGIFYGLGVTLDALSSKSTMIGTEP